MLTVQQGSPGEGDVVESEVQAAHKVGLFYLQVCVGLSSVAEQTVVSRKQDLDHLCRIGGSGGSQRGRRGSGSEDACPPLDGVVHSRGVPPHFHSAVGAYAASHPASGETHSSSLQTVGSAASPYPLHLGGDIGVASGGRGSGGGEGV